MGSTFLRVIEALWRCGASSSARGACPSARGGDSSACGDLWSACGGGPSGPRTSLRMWSMSLRVWRTSPRMWRRSVLGSLREKPVSGNPARAGPGRVWTRGGGAGLFGRGVAASRPGTPTACRSEVGGGAPPRARKLGTASRTCARNRSAPTVTGDRAEGVVCAPDEFVGGLRRSEDLKTREAASIDFEKMTRVRSGRGPIDRWKIAAVARRKPWVQSSLGPLHYRCGLNH